MKKIKVLLVEDHYLTRIGLRFSLDKFDSVEIIGEAEDGEQGINQAMGLLPDVILMDLGLPNINGIDATKEIKKSKPEIKIIILTSHTDEEEVLAAFAAGADAYCIKDIKPERLLTAIESVNEGVVWLDPEIAKIVMKQVGPSQTKHNVSETNMEELNLTPRETEVLQLIVEGCSNQDIADRLVISMHTVKTHISNILSKLEVDDRTQAALKAVKSSSFK